MSTYNLIYTTFSNIDDAKVLARNVVKEKFAACANIIPAGISVYEWEGEIKEDAEHIVIIKTRHALVEKARQYISTHHPYEVPAIFTIDISNIDEKYKEWLDMQTS